jgi:hypothetical protein
VVSYHGWDYCIPAVLDETEKARQDALARLQARRNAAAVRLARERAEAVLMTSDEQQQQHQPLRDGGQANVDADGNGFVSNRKFIRWHESTHEKSVSDTALREFYEADDNGDAKTSVAELRIHYLAQDPPRPAASAAERAAAAAAVLRNVGSEKVELAERATALAAADALAEAAAAREQHAVTQGIVDLALEMDVMAAELDTVGKVATEKVPYLTPSQKTAAATEAAAEQQARATVQEVAAQEAAPKAAAAADTATAEKISIEKAAAEKATAEKAAAERVAAAAKEAAKVVTDEKAAVAKTVAAKKAAPAADEVAAATAADKAAKVAVNKAAADKAAAAKEAAKAEAAPNNVAARRQLNQQREQWRGAASEATTVAAAAANGPPPWVGDLSLELSATGATPLQVAVADHSTTPEAVRALLAPWQAADPTGAAAALYANWADIGDDTALGTAARRGEAALVKVLFYPRQSTALRPASGFGTCSLQRIDVGGSFPLCATAQGCEWRA